jgi:hypothetical protein
MSVIKLLADRAAQPITVISTEANSLATNAACISAAAIDNDSNLDLFADFELKVTFAVAPVADTVIELYLVRTIDAGVSFEDAITAATYIGPKEGFVGAWALRAVTTAQILIIPMIYLPALDFKVFIGNKTAQSFPASGSTVRMYAYKKQVV